MYEYSSMMAKLWCSPLRMLGYFVREVWLEPNLFPYKYPNIQPQSFFIPTRFWGWNRVFWNMGIRNSDAGELPRKSVQHSEYIKSLKSRWQLPDCEIFSPRVVVCCNLDYPLISLIACDEIIYSFSSTGSKNPKYFYFI
jgi:hypothetical protein